MAFGLIESRWHPVGFAYQDRLLDNVPQYAACAHYVAPADAEAALASFPAPAAVEGHVTDRCEGRAGIEFQYSSHDQRGQLEAALSKDGNWFAGAGWFLRGVPIELKNT